MRITDASFVVTDTETTGVRAGEDRLIEIAAVRVSGGFVKERFQQLINPGCPIPGHITRLTGISTRMVVDQPDAREVLPRFLSFLDRGVFVAHNLGFDLRFVNSGLRDCERPELSSHTLCTLRLARRLLPGLRSKSLASVCEFFRIRNRSAHRALGDAEATAEVLLRFLEILDREHRIESLEELIAFQRRPYRTASRSRHLVEIRRRVLQHLPTEPGVYFMKDAGGSVIYIGKARDLKARVTSYFTAIEGHPPRLRKMVEVVRDVTWQTTETELDALILESRLIKETQPRFNRAQRQYHVRPFLRLDTTHPFPYVSVVPVLRNDGARYFGPFESREKADRVGWTVERFFLLRTCTNDQLEAGTPCDRARAGCCGAPCAGYVTQEAYASEVDRVLALLDGTDTSVFDRMRSAMRAAAIALHYEEAATLRDALQTMEALLERDGCIAPSVLDQNAVLAHVEGNHASESDLRLHLIRHGRLQESLRLPVRLSGRDRKELARRLDRYFHPDLDIPERYYVEETDEVRLIRQWAFTNRSRIERVPWQEDVSPSVLLERVVDAVHRLTAEAPGATS